MKKLPLSIIATAVFSALLFPFLYTDSDDISGIEPESVLSAEHVKDTHYEKIIRGEKAKLRKDEIKNMVNKAKDDVSTEFVLAILKEDLTTDDIIKISSSVDSSIPPHHKENRPKVGKGQYVAMTIPEETSVEDFLVELNENSNVLIAEPAYKRKLFWTPDDTQFSTQWQLQNITTDYSIEMPDAWDYVDTQLDPILGAGDNHGGDPSIVVAVLDTGLAMNNRTVPVRGYTTYEQQWNFDIISELPVNIWENTDETAGDIDDDDGNGFIDDQYGVNIDDYYNYEIVYQGHNEEDGYADDDYGHGTHVSLTIASATNNTAQGAGIAFSTTIMPIKIFDYVGDIWSYSVVDAISYAIDNDADIINMSFGGSMPSTVEEAVLSSAVSNGLIPVAASGNNGNTTIQYPAGYRYSLAIGASNKNGSRSSYSSYGNWIDIVAPVGDATGGSGVYQHNYDCYHAASQSNPLPCTIDQTSTWDPKVNSFTTGNFSFAPSQGTSFAAPEVSAVVALMKSLNPSWDFYTVQYILRKSSVDVGTTGFDIYTGYGILNANNAVKAMMNNGTIGELKPWRVNYGWPDATYLVGDFDHDSNSDDITIGYETYTYPGKYTWWVMNSTGSGFLGGSNWRENYGWPDATYLVGNYDEDLYFDDIVIGYETNTYPGKYTWWVMNSTGSSFAGGSNWRENYGWPDSTFLVGDYDHDSYIDDIAIGHVTNTYPGKYTWWVMNSTGSSFAGGSNWRENYGWPDATYLVGDFDQDGDRDDIAIGYETYAYPGKYTWWVMNSTGSSFAGGSNWRENYGWPDATYLVGDFDQDGYFDDIAIGRYTLTYPNEQTWWVLRSTGSGFLGGSSWKQGLGKTSATFLVGDFDNDTYEDDIAFGQPISSYTTKNSWWVLRSNGSSF